MNGIPMVRVQLLSALLIRTGTHRLLVCFGALMKSIGKYRMLYARDQGRQALHDLNSSGGNASRRGSGYSLCARACALKTGFLQGKTLIGQQALE
jgi:hypothetical protein